MRNAHLGVIDAIHKEVAHKDILLRVVLCHNLLQRSRSVNALASVDETNLVSPPGADFSYER